MTGRRLTVRTPEGIVFSWPLAGPVSRMLALLIDLCCISVAFYVLQQAIRVLRVVSADWATGIAVLLFFGLQIGYGIAFEWMWRGQTIGKRVLRIRVIDGEGLRLTPGQIILRNLLRAVDSLPVFYAVGGVACAVTRHAQRLGDLAANTVVIHHQQAATPELSEALRLRYNSLRQWPHLCARLRQRSTPEEAGAALEAILRREELDAEPRLELFDDLARHFQSKVEFPAEALDGLSSEQYIRDVVQVLFETGARGRD
ncbi:MAG: RDD family protein [Bryobacteraceae bacterium]